MSPTISINTFYQAIIDKQVDAIHQSYAYEEKNYVILNGPRLEASEYSNASKGWLDFCESDLCLNSIQWQGGPREKIGENLAWITGVIKLVIDHKGKVFEQIFRVSFVLCREKNQWKIQEEHLAGTLEDPYEVGDWLKL